MGKNKRRHERHKKRIRLQYQIGEDKWRTGFTTDVSAMGLFIATANVPSTTTTIRVRVDYNQEQFEMSGRILRGKKVPPRLRQLVKGGVAVSLSDIPEAWFRMCQELEEKQRRKRSTTRFPPMAAKVPT